MVNYTECQILKKTIQKKFGQKTYVCKKGCGCSFEKENKTMERKARKLVHKFKKKLGER